MPTELTPFTPEWHYQIPQLLMNKRYPLSYRAIKIQSKRHLYVFLSASARMSVIHSFVGISTIVSFSAALIQGDDPHQRSISVSTRHSSSEGTKCTSAILYITGGATSYKCPVSSQTYCTCETVCSRAVPWFSWNRNFERCPPVTLAAAQEHCFDQFQICSYIRGKSSDTPQWYFRSKLQPSWRS